MCLGHNVNHYVQWFCWFHIWTNLNKMINWKTIPNQLLIFPNISFMAYLLKVLAHVPSHDMCCIHPKLWIGSNIFSNLHTSRYTHHANIWFLENKLGWIIYPIHTWEYIWVKKDILAQHWLKPMLGRYLKSLKPIN
jgi:hypothetical protein